VNPADEFQQYLGVDTCPRVISIAHRDISRQVEGIRKLLPDDLIGLVTRVPRSFRPAPLLAKFVKELPPGFDMFLLYFTHNGKAFTLAAVQPIDWYCSLMPAVELLNTPHSLESLPPEPTFFETNSQVDLCSRAEDLISRWKRGRAPRTDTIRLLNRALRVGAVDYEQGETALLALQHLPARPSVPLTVRNMIVEALQTMTEEE